MPAPPPKFILIGIPDGDRTAGFQAALAGFGLPRATVIGYGDWLTAGTKIGDEFCDAWGDEPTFVRIDSPGDDETIERELIAHGEPNGDERGDEFGERYASIGADEIRRLPADRGRILFPRQWYVGFCRVLRRIGEHVRAGGAHLKLLSDPDEVAVMFDKRACHAHLLAHDIPVPRGIAPVRNFAELEAAMHAAKLFRVFVKLAHGSAASGVVALEMAGARVQATTSAKLVRNGDACGDAEGVRLYNSKRICKYRERADVAALIDELCRHRVHVEAWVPKAGFAGLAFDLRVLVIGGEPAHVVVRQSPTPLTNLHLGRDNRRGDVDALRQFVGENAWGEMLGVCARVGAAFPKSFCIGVDVLLTAHTFRPYVLEVNAFGDWLKRTRHRGFDPWQAQIAALCSRFADLLPPKIAP